VRRPRPGWSHWRRIVGVVLVAGLLPFLLGASVPAAASCPWNEKPLAVFDVADRAALARHVPGLAKTPEVAGDPILVNGKPAGLEGRLHITVFDCLPWSSIPTYYWPSTRGSGPDEVRNIVVVQKLDRDAWWFADVDLTRLTP
jgi:hypothetical protein